MEEKDAKGAPGPLPFFQEKRILVVAAIVLIADQLTKQIVANTIDTADQVIVALSGNVTYGTPINFIEIVAFVA